MLEFIFFILTFGNTKKHDKWRLVIFYIFSHHSWHKLWSLNAHLYFESAMLVWKPEQNLSTCLAFFTSSLISLWFIWLRIMINLQYTWPYQLYALRLRFACLSPVSFETNMKLLFNKARRILLHTHMGIISSIWLISETFCTFHRIRFQIISWTTYWKCINQWWWFTFLLTIQKNPSSFKWPIASLS